MLTQIIRRAARTSAREPLAVAARGLSQTQPSPSLEAWMEEMRALKPKTEHDLIDLVRARQLHQTLPYLRSESIPVEGQPLRFGHHLVYFQPSVNLDELSRDGTWSEYNAPAPFNRRMWAAGSITWHPERDITIGLSVGEVRSVESVVAKAGMIFVTQKRVIYGANKGLDGEALLEEKRTHVFRPSLDESTPKVKPVSPAPPGSTVGEVPGQVAITLVPTDTMLFRFSALTMNAHKIHVDRDWARNEEGHDDLVVHGPLSAATLVETANRTLDPSQRLASFNYRATSPMYVSGGDIQFLAAPHAEEGTIALTATTRGRVGMRGQAQIR